MPYYFLCNCHNNTKNIFANFQKKPRKIPQDRLKNTVKWPPGEELSKHSSGTKNIFTNLYVKGLRV